jgi:DNA-3-methyladenine glycosylase II
MSPAPFPFDRDEAVKHLRAKDARLRRLIDRVGPFTLELDGAASTFAALGEAIIYQQLAGAAALAIYKRVTESFGKRTFPSPREIASAPTLQLRRAGLSRSKTVALKDLAAKTIDGTVPSRAKLHRMGDVEIVERITHVHGIGPWTVEMMLMFQLGRPDVLPATDFGVQTGFQLTYRKEALPKPKELLAFGERWRPFRSVASWYMWRAVHLHRQRKNPERKSANRA